MRILHILDHSIPLHSGYTFRSRAILKQQQAMGWETCHLTSPKQGKTDLPVEEVDGLTFYRTPVPAHWLMNMPLCSQMAIVTALKKRLNSVIEVVKPDILHAHSPSLNGLAALSAARSHNLPLVYEVRAFWEDAAVDHGTSSEWGLRYRLTRATETRVLKGASAITTICNGLRNEMIGRGIGENKITVIPNAVDQDQFQVIHEPDQTLRDELGLQGKTVLGFLGSFYAYEGLSLLIDALPQMLEANPDIRILLVGGGPEEASLKSQVKLAQLQDRVIFTGRVPHDQVQAYYSLVDLLIYPRLSMRLTDLVTPLKPLEAMAQEKLVVASDVGGHKELIRDGENGFLFAAGDAAALAQRVLKTLADRHLWPAIKAQGRKYVEQERNWAVSVSHYEKVYRQITNQGKP